MTLSSLRAFPQSTNDEAEKQNTISRLCEGNTDCLNYYQNREYLSALLSIGDPFVAIKGKKKQDRAGIMTGASSYLTNHHLLHGGSAWRYLSCVSKALAGEAGNKTTIFSSENIIETFYALSSGANDDVIAPGILTVCDSLETYYKQFSASTTLERENREVLQKKEKRTKLVASDVWHQILLESVKRRQPASNPDNTILEWQKTYCLFADTCPASKNSPFAGASTAK